MQNYKDGCGDKEFVWLAKHPKFENVERYTFCEYVKGNFVSPSEYYKTHKLNL